MSHRPPDVDISKLLRMVEELRRVNPEAVKRIEAWTDRLLDGAPVAEIEAEMKLFYGDLPHTH